MLTIGNLTSINLGWQGENNSRTIQVDVSAWLEQFPGATINLLVQRPGDDEFYPANTKIENGVLEWTLRRADVQLDGEGKAQMVLTGTDGLEMRSRVVKTVIGDSIDGTEGEAPAPIESWVQEVLQAANTVRTAVDAGEGTLYLIQQKGNTTDRTYDEINAAINAKKTCILTDTLGRVHLYSNRNSYGTLIFRAIEHGVPISGGAYTSITEREVHIAKDGKVSSIAISPINAPNPMALTIEQNGQTVTYDGKKAVNIKIEGGGSIPDPGKAHQQLVSDADGKAVWQDALAYKYVKAGTMTLFAEETLMNGEGEDEGSMFFSATPLTAIPEVGKQYEVTINGTVYTTTAHPLEDNGAVMGVMLGNAGTMYPDDYEDTGEPYVLLTILPEYQAMTGGMTMIMLSDLDVTPITLSIKGQATITTVKKIDKDLLPDTHKTITIMIDADGNVMCDTPFAEVSKMTCGELQSALKIVQTGSYGGQPSELEADVHVRRQASDVLGDVLEITFRQYADPADTAGGREITRYIYWSALGLRLANFTLSSLPIMDAGWGYNQQTYYLRSVGGKWQPVSIEQMKQDAEHAQADWMQSNPSGSSYVKNRTHYTVDAVSIPRNTPADEGAPSARIYKSSGAEYAVRWVKVSDVTPSAEIVIGAGTVQYNANNALGITEECILDSTSDGYVIGRDVYTESTGRTLRTAYAVVCFNAGYQANGFPAPEVITSLSTATIPEPGLYLPVTDAEQNTYTGFALPEYIKVLDDKYIPDNIARKTDLENIEVPDDHINGLIDQKLDAFGRTGAVVMPETTFDHNGSTVTIHTPWAVEVKAGNEYIVTIDGKVYRYAAVGYSVNGIPLTMIGNGDGYAEVEHLNPDAPFSIMVASNAVGAQMGMYGTITKHDGIHSYTISIVEASRTGYYYYDGTQARLVTIKELKKALGVSDTGATILPETTVTLEDNMGFIVDQLSGTPEVETTYTVMYNGVAYDCPALEFVDDGVAGVILGNSDMFEQPGGNPDAPFAMVLIPTGADGMYGMFVDLSGATEVTLSVVEQGGTVADKPYVNKDVTVIDAGLTYSRGVVEIRQEGNMLWLQDSGVYNFTDAFETANNRTVLQFTLPKKLSDRIPNVNGVYGTTGTVMYFPALAYENVTYTTFNCQSYIKRSAIGDTEDTYQVVYTGCSAISGGGLCGFHLRMPILMVGE